MYRCLQINLNRSYGAQNLLMQLMAERDIGIGIISEPNNCPPSSNPLWITDRTGLAAIVWRPSLPFRCIPLRSGPGYVAAQCGDIVIVACYLSPNMPLVEYSLAMQELSEVLLGVRPSPVLLAGDFNARSPLWGCNSTSNNAEYLCELMDTLDMRLVNIGAVPTCVRPQGSSVVDLVWTSAGLREHIKAWRVLTEEESLSDHRYLEYEVHPRIDRTARTPSALKLPRWAMKKFDDDRFLGAIHAMTWNQPEVAISLEDMVRNIGRIMSDACDFAAPRVRYVSRRATYWWTAEIVELRRSCNRRRRHLTRVNRRGSVEDKLEASSEYKEARKNLRKAIWSSKKTAWKGLLDDLDADPWGRPYKMVIKKMGSTAISATELLVPNELEVLLTDLFPSGNHGCAEVTSDLVALWMDNVAIPDVAVADVKRVLRGKKSKRTAPGPDGVCKEVWQKLPQELLGAIARMFFRCLTEGTFPKAWKTATLVLIPKPTDPGMPLKYRPICLLDDIGKALERIIAERISAALQVPGNGLADRQYGFREGLSTVEALFVVRDYAVRAREDGQSTVAISLDIRNAFNSLPWDVVLMQMRRKKIPPYLIRIVRSYFSERCVIFKDSSGEHQNRTVTAGVPQGSVLGPLLWNLTYDWVLEVKEWSGCSVVCYADDTFVLARGDTPRIAAAKATVFAGSVVHRIRQLGLEIAAHKTEAVLFGDRGVFHELFIYIEGERITVKSCIKHLGVVLDRALTFKAHFKYIEEKALKMVRLLWRILPNLKGPSALKRQLYAGVLHSVILYASPLWSDSLSRWVTYRAPLLKIQRQMALRVVSGYRTISYEAALLLARIPPIHLLAARHRRIYERSRELARRQEYTVEAKAEIREAATLLMRRQWLAALDREDCPGVRVREAIIPVFDRWLDHRKAGVNYYITQLFTGHGSFGQYLHRIGKREYPACPDCGIEEDTVEHVMEECPRWTAERHSLRAVFEEDIPLRWAEMIPSALDYEQRWKAIARFAREVLTAREAAEREGGG